METEFLINSAGLFSDEIARMVNPENSYEIVAARGEIMQFDSSMRKDIALRGIHLYSTPYFYDNETKQIADITSDQIHKSLKQGNVTKTLGVHLSPVLDGRTVTVGPLKTLRVGKNDYTTNLQLPRMYIDQVHKIFPNLRVSDLRPKFSGIMAVLKGKTDFVIEKDQKYENCIHLVGMDSPAWTSCLAIARYVREMVT